jgi:hypothetical protein
MNFFFLKKKTRALLSWWFVVSRAFFFCEDPQKGIRHPYSRGTQTLRSPATARRYRMLSFFRKNLSFFTVSH